MATDWLTINYRCVHSLILKCNIKILDDTDYNLGHPEHRSNGLHGSPDQIYCLIYK